jgi:hypothetical protein
MMFNVLSARGREVIAGEAKAVLRSIAMRGMPERGIRKPVQPPKASAHRCPPVIVFVLGRPQCRSPGAGEERS